MDKLPLLADAAAGIANLVLATVLFRLVVRLRRDMLLHRTFLALGVFIAVCGLADLFNVWVFWRPQDVTGLALELVAATLAAVSATVLTLSAPHIIRVVTEAGERRRLEEALRRSEARYRLVMRATHDAIYDRDLRTGRLTLDGAFETTYRYNSVPPDLSVAWWKERLHVDDANRILESLTAALHHGAELWSEEYRFCRGDGTYAEVLDRALVVRSPDGEPVRLVGSLSDLSVRRQLQDQLRHSQRMEAVGRLAGGVAHELNNMLTTIKAYAAFLIDDLDESDPRRVDAQEIVTAADRAAAVTRQLLAYGRKQVLQPRIINLNEFVIDMKHTLERILGPHIEVRLEMGARAGYIRVDPAQLEQVMLNLAFNARDAMPDGGLLSIRTQDVDSAAEPWQQIPGGHYTALFVSDTGIGMDPDVVANIFDPFFTTKMVGEGTGLGLASVYGIVRQSGGYVRVQSRRGMGTTFAVLFPSAAGDTALAEQAASHSQRTA